MGNFGQNPGQTSSGDRLRQFCPYCGTKLDVGARFCKHCGESVETKIDVGSKTQQKDRVESNPSQRKTVYEGYLHKCPSCGQILESFVSHCPTCGYEIRDTKSATAVREFELKLQDITERQMPAFEEKKSVMKMVFGRDFKNSDDEAIARRNFEDQKNEEKATLIINFSVPNTKEDILEFMILAASNIDVKKGVEDKVSQAWLAKLKQVYQKAQISISDQSDFDQIQEIYDRKMTEIRNKKIRGVLKWVGIADAWCCCMFFLFNPVLIISITGVVAVLLIIGYFHFK